jgi:hypothetical protein
MYRATSAAKKNTNLKVKVHVPIFFFFFKDKMGHPKRNTSFQFTSLKNKVTALVAVK